MSNNIQFVTRVAAVVALCLATVNIPSTQAQSGVGNQADFSARSNSSSLVGEAFTTQEKKQIIDKFLAYPQVIRQIGNQRIRVLSITSASIDKDATAQQHNSPLASLLLFNYSTNKATRYLINAASGEVLREEPLPGRPPASAEEVQEAIRIIRANPELAQLLQAGGVLEGGFIVDDPNGVSPDHRYLQMQLLTSDRLQLQRWVSVDLTNRTISSTRRE